MRNVKLLLLISTVLLVLAETSVAQMTITGGGEYKDRKGIHVRAYSTFPSLVRLANGKLLCYDMASQDGGRTWSRYREPRSGGRYSALNIPAAASRLFFRGLVDLRFRCASPMALTLVHTPTRRASEENRKPR